VSERVALIRSSEARAYDHGPQHPLRPQRVLLTWNLIEAYGLDAAPGVLSVDATGADDATLELVHTPAYLDATRRAGHGEDGDWGRFGYGPGDNPIFDRMHEAASAVTGATLEAARTVWSGEVQHAFNAAGGLHHAMPARASGFCVYDDPAVAIAWLLREGAERIAYVDVDVHHGDGPQRIFYEDPRVLTISIHEYAPQLGFFPGTGGLDESGGPGAEGTAINVPLPPGTSDTGWLSAFRAVVPDAVRRFAPQVLVTQLGCDTHQSDPLAHMRLTTAAYRATAAELHALAHETTGGRWVATGGGGYQWARVVPRAWTLYFAEMAGAQVDDAIPESWIERVEFTLRSEVPVTLTEPAVPAGAADEDAAEIGEVVRRIVLEEGVAP
jgi:acetoin utilization protein AcuC